MRPQVGQVINNKYRLLRLIGDGGMGSVYEARHEVLGTSVALKFLHSELAKRPGLVQRFLQEARVSAQIQSPHVVRVTDVDQTPGGAFIVMEYIEGKTLQALYEDLYKAGVQLSYADALEYALQMLEGVEAAHKTGIVHRDLKPDNVMITLDGKGRTVIKLLDFGIAKLKVSGDYDRGLTRPGVIMGTPEYMAPEQAFSADAVDARACIISLGVMVFEMLAGRRPVGGEDAHQIATAYLSGHVARLNDLAPDIAPPLADAVHRAMAPLPGDRWASDTAFRDVIEPFGVAVRAPSAMPPSPSMVMAAIPSGAMKAFPSVPPRAPPETNPGLLAGQGPIPKTLPPEGDTDADAVAPPQQQAHEAPTAASSIGGTGARPSPDASARAAPRDATLPADPPSMTNPPSREPTPLGGFSAFGVDTAEKHAEKHAERRAPVSASANGTVAAAVFPATRSVAPLRDGGATVLATPLAGTVPVFDASPRTGSMASTPDPRPVLPSAAYVPSIAARPPATTPRKRPSPLSSLPAILALAAAVSAMVVGGVYLAHRSAKIDDHEDLPPPPPVATVVSDPPPDEPPSTAAPVLPPPGPQRPWRPSTPLTPPAPTGSVGPVAPPAPSSSAPRQVPIIPSVWVLPSTFPFSFPFGPRPPADPPRGQQPDGPPPDGPPPDGPPRDRPPRGERLMPRNLASPQPARRPRPPPPPPPPDAPYWY